MFEQSGCGWLEPWWENVASLRKEHRVKGLSPDQYSVHGLAHHKSFVARCLEHPTSVWKVIGSIPVGDSRFFPFPVLITSLLYHFSHTICFQTTSLYTGLRSPWRKLAYEGDDSSSSESLLERPKYEQHEGMWSSPYSFFVVKYTTFFSVLHLPFCLLTYLLSSKEQSPKSNKRYNFLKALVCFEGIQGIQ